MQTSTYPGIIDSTPRTVPGISEELMWVFIMGVVYKILALLIELKVCHTVWNGLVRITIVIFGKLHLYKRKDKEGEAGPVDEDVEAER